MPLSNEIEMTIECDTEVLPIVNFKPVETLLNVSLNELEIPGVTKKEFDALIKALHEREQEALATNQLFDCLNNYFVHLAGSHHQELKSFDVFYVEQRKEQMEADYILQSSACLVKGLAASLCIGVLASLPALAALALTLVLFSIGLALLLTVDSTDYFFGPEMVASILFIAAAVVMVYVSMFSLVGCIMFGGENIYKRAVERNNEYQQIKAEYEQLKNSSRDDCGLDDMQLECLKRFLDGLKNHIENSFSNRASEDVALQEAPKECDIEVLREQTYELGDANSSKKTLPQKVRGCCSSFFQPKEKTDDVSDDAHSLEHAL